MISGLLWRCPICKTDDSINHEYRKFRPDIVSCSSCDSVWELIRVKGADFRFKAVAGSMAGTEKPLAAWYDMIRDTFELESINPGELVLEQGETLYFKGKPQSLFVMRVDPLFKPVVEKLPPPPEGAVGLDAMMVNIGPVDIYLTNKRKITIYDNQQFDKSLTTVRGVEVLIDRFVILHHVKQLVEIIKLEGESPLKWRAHLDALLRPVSDELGINIRMAYD